MVSPKFDAEDPPALPDDVATDVFGALRPVDANAAPPDESDEEDGLNATPFMREKRRVRRRDAVIDHIRAAFDKFVVLAQGARATQRYLRARIVTDELAHWIVHRHKYRRGTLEMFTHSVVRTIIVRELQKLGGRRLTVERRDAALRRAAIKDKKCLVDYLLWGRARIESAMRMHPRRWHLPGYTSEELVAAIQLYVLERFDFDRLASEERPGRSAYLSAAWRFRDSKKRKRRLTDVSHGIGRPDEVSPHVATPEELILRLQPGLAQLIARDRKQLMPARLAKTYSALLSAVELIEHSRDDTWGLAARAAKTMGKNRATVTRDMKAIRAGLLASKYGSDLTLAFGDAAPWTRAIVPTRRRRERNAAVLRRVAAVSSPPWTPPLHPFRHEQVLIRRALRRCARDPAASTSACERLRRCLPIRDAAGARAAIAAIDAVLNTAVWLGPSASSALEEAKAWLDVPF